MALINFKDMLTKLHIIDNLTTDDNTKVLSAKQGKKLKEELDKKVSSVDGKGLSSNDFTDDDKSKLDGIADNANNYVHPGSHPANMITEDSTHRFVTDTQKSLWSDKYTKSEIDNKFLAYTKDLDWKEAVASFEDIATTYPNPEKGWTVSVNDTDTLYRYNGKEWVAISSNSIPNATHSVDGKMSKEDKAKLDGIADNANKYVHPNSGVTAGTYKSVTVDSKGHVTGGTNPTTNAGSTTKPVYFKNGEPVAINYNINKDVPPDAKFTDTVYAHPDSGVTAGTFRSVTVDSKGHVTGGTNPTTLAGYGITDAAKSNHTHDTIGDTTIKVIVQSGNEINFIKPDGASNASGRLYFGYKSNDTCFLPDLLIFGGSTGKTSLAANQYYIGGPEGPRMAYNSTDKAISFIFD